MSGRRASDWVADFETTTVPTLDLEGETRVWAWGFANVHTAKSAWDVEMGNTVESFMDKMSNVGGTVYFHNLKFDGSFILNWLLRNGYEWTSSNYPRHSQFTTLISRDGNFYNICVKWKSGVTTEFRDSLKKLPMPVRDVAKAFNLTEAKGILDYDTYRPIGHVLTREEREYLALDVLIMAKALKTQLDAGLTKMTVGADALAEYKRRIGKKLFTRWFPVLPQDTDDFIRKSYRGGWTYVDKRRRGKLCGSGRVYDVNSLYPSVMYDCLLPHGEPVPFQGHPAPNDRYPLFIVSVTFTAKLRRNHVPCIQIKGSIHFNAVEYQRVIAEPVTLVCTNVDLALWREHYQIDILSYNGGFLFKGERGMFKEYIDYWMGVKANSTGGMRQLAKLQLNSLYGKFATNPDVTGKIPYLENGVLKFATGDPEERDPVYTAMGSFITAYARDKTIRAAQANYATFAYADTDSLHLLSDDYPESLDIHPTALGAWKFEYTFSEARWQAPKRYVEHRTTWNPEKGEHEWEVHIAGLPQDIAQHIRPSDFGRSLKVPGKLQAMQVRGGVVLREVDFTLDT